MIIRQTLVVLTALLSASACALAQTFSVGNLTYSVTDKTAGEVDVSSCESYESEIDVPATVSHGGISYKVTGIGITAFSVKSSLRRIGLPRHTAYRRRGLCLLQPAYVDVAACQRGEHRQQGVQRMPYAIAREHG